MVSYNILVPSRGGGKKLTCKSPWVSDYLTKPNRRPSKSPRLECLVVLESKPNLLRSGLGKHNADEHQYPAPITSMKIYRHFFLDSCADTIPKSGSCKSVR